MTDDEIEAIKNRAWTCGVQTYPAAIAGIVDEILRLRQEVRAQASELATLRASQP